MYVCIYRVVPFIIIIYLIFHLVCCRSTAPITERISFGIAREGISHLVANVQFDFGTLRISAARAYQVEKMSVSLPTRSSDFIAGSEDVVRLDAVPQRCMESSTFYAGL